jgi:hypothetical protein
MGELKELSFNLECAICHNILTDPIRDACGHTFDKHCFNNWIATKNTCPMTNLVLEHTGTSVNLEMKELLKEYHSGKHGNVVIPAGTDQQNEKIYCQSVRTFCQYIVSFVFNRYTWLSLVIGLLFLISVVMLVWDSEKFTIVSSSVKLQGKCYQIDFKACRDETCIDGQDQACDVSEEYINEKYAVNETITYYKSALNNSYERNRTDSPIFTGGVVLIFLSMYLMVYIYMFICKVSKKRILIASAVTTPAVIFLILSVLEVFGESVLIWSICVFVFFNMSCAIYIVSKQDCCYADHISAENNENQYNCGYTWLSIINWIFSAIVLICVLYMIQPGEDIMNHWSSVDCTITENDVFFVAGNNCYKISYDYCIDDTDICGKTKYKLCETNQDTINHILQNDIYLNRTGTCDYNSETNKLFFYTGASSYKNSGESLFIGGVFLVVLISATVLIWKISCFVCHGC